MRYFILILLCLSSLGRAQTSSAVAALANQPAAVFSIDPMARGSDIVTMFATLSSTALGYKTASSQIAVQTTRNGLLYNVQSIQKTTNNTILIFTYGSTFSPLYVAIPTEQITAIVYSPYTIPSTSTFSSTPTTGVFPYFSIDLSERAADIQTAFNIFNTMSPYETALSQVALQTTLSGPFYPSSLTNGFIPNIQSISLTPAPNGTLMLVLYQIGSQNYSIVVAPEQVYSIVYTPR